MSHEQSLEEEYGFRDRKERRQERREASKRDRSQFKISDLKKKRKKELHPDIKNRPEDFIKGRIIGIVSQDVKVDVDGVVYTCVVRGILKRDRSQMKNIIAVGDLVFFESRGEKEGVIAHIEERSSILSRADNLSRRQQQIIATNVDQVLITMSVSNPPLKPFLIDRYIIAAEKGNMTPVIVINKLDLLADNPDDEDFYEEVLEAYKCTDIPIVGVSVVTRVGIDLLNEIMKDKVSVFSGQSGVGKSSLINEITGSDFATRETAKHTGKGSHTTTSTCLLPLSDGGWCVDTPGIKSFGVWNLDMDEIQSYFTEISEKAGECKFGSCSHLHEPQCAVRDAVEEGEIHPIRYASFCQLVESCGSEHKRR